MDRECRRCRTRHPAHANFCAVCGRRLISRQPVSTLRTGRLALAVVAAGLITFGVFAAARPVQVTVSRTFDLPTATARTMFELLRPRDVMVIVAKLEDPAAGDGRIRISGTPRECRALADFVHLITRFADQSPGEVDQCMAASRKNWTTDRRYKLSAKMAKLLHNTLAPDDVPVLVSRSGRRVRVDASLEDQRTVSKVVDILRGYRL